MQLVLGRYDVFLAWRRDHVNSDTRNARWIHDLSGLLGYDLGTEVVVLFGADPFLVLLARERGYVIRHEG